jgi:hypothetical protein
LSATKQRRQCHVNRYVIIRMLLEYVFNVRPGINDQAETSNKRMTLRISGFVDFVNPVF